ncbi:hypothetical protein KGQ64_00735 [bacterium]|nr:hypothetical protein [bacterium]
MKAPHPALRPGRLRRFALASFLALAAAGCGNGDGCAGYISINASPEECARIAERFGCASFDATGPSCGLQACARCNGIDSSS